MTDSECPTCKGKRMLRGDAYSNNSGPWRCDTCGGTGMSERFKSKRDKGENLVDPIRATVNPMTDKKESLTDRLRRRGFKPVPNPGTVFLTDPTPIQSVIDAAVPEGWGWRIDSPVRGEAIYLCTLYDEDDVSVACIGEGKTIDEALADARAKIEEK